MTTNVLGGIGVAAGIAVAALLVQQVAGTAWSGFGAALSVLGAGLAAVPLAQLAARRGRRGALATGYRIAAVGAVLAVLGAALSSVAVLFAALLLVGAGQATNLQTRFAGADFAEGPRRATLLSLVFWATTIGSVLGPNLVGVGDRIGAGLRVPGLAGSFVIAGAAFLLASVVAATLPRGTTTGGGPTQRRAVSAPAALRWALGHPVARYAVVLSAVAHGVMVGVMSMTPVSLHGHGHGLQVVGLVVSLHVLGMFALSPLFGWLSDRLGPVRVSILGLGILLLALALGVLAASGQLALTATAMVLLGVGWSASIISASALLAGLDSGEVRVPLQGASDALMNYVAAGAAALGGPVMAVLGYGGLNIGAGLLLVPAVVAAVAAVRST